METALFFEGREVNHIKNYARQNTYFSSVGVGKTYFPQIGQDGEYFSIDSVLLFAPSGKNDFVRILPIQPPVGQLLYLHAGGTGICLRFHLSDGAAKATERTQALTDAMRDIIDRLETVEVTGDVPEVPQEKPDDIPF
ncbi:hypothetical protein [Magnetospirillum moscoviense]|nr:hypothetical protein [Magnetospirillum moscoviense]